MTALAETPDGVVISVRVVPRSSRDEIAGCIGDAVKVRLRAPPVEGAANKALAAFLAEALGLRPRDVTILSGEGSRQKRVLARGVTAAAAAVRLGVAHDA